MPQTPHAQSTRGACLNVDSKRPFLQGCRSRAASRSKRSKSFGASLPEPTRRGWLLSYIMLCFKCCLCLRSCGARNPALEAGASSPPPEKGRAGPRVMAAFSLCHWLHSPRGTRSAGRPGTSRPSAGRPPAAAPRLPVSSCLAQDLLHPLVALASSKQSAATSRIALGTPPTVQKARSRATKFRGSSAWEPHHLTAPKQT